MPQSRGSFIWTFYVTLVVSLGTTALSNALECYACSYLDGYSDMRCLNNASALKPINCTKKYCLTVRQEAIHNASKVISFARDCQDKPLVLNGVRTDASFRFYFRSCQQNLCNGHNGRVYNSSGSGAGLNHNAIIPGKSGSSALSLSCLMLLLLLLFMWSCCN